jgi:hypothetical protein
VSVNDEFDRWQEQERATANAAFEKKLAEIESMLTPDVLAEMAARADEYEKGWAQRLASISSRPDPSGPRDIEYLRRLLFYGIRIALEQDSHCKSYEGAVEVRYPDFFEWREGEGPWTVKVHCYVLGPSRHYDFSGATLDEAVGKAIDAVEAWVTAEESASR